MVQRSQGYSCMDNFMDRAWELILVFFSKAALVVDTMFSPLEIFGPGLVIFSLSFFVILITRLISRFYVTKRYVELKKNFQYWQSIREEAMKLPDREKGKGIAKNIDQAELNRAYYDYFFESLLKHFLTNVIPILFMASYVTTTYTPETLMEKFGKEWVFTFEFSSSSPINMSSLFWFIICIFLSLILYGVLKKIVTRFAKKKNAQELSG